MSDGMTGALPGLAEARGWLGCEVDDASGSPVGRAEGLYADAESGSPVWLVVGTGRRRRAKSIAIPLRECAAMPGRVWTAQAAEAVRAAPAVDPTRPLLREHEQALCAHYGIGGRIGRHAEVVGRAAGAITAQPA